MRQGWKLKRAQGLDKLSPRVSGKVLEHRHLLEHFSRHHPMHVGIYRLLFRQYPQKRFFFHLQTTSPYARHNNRLSLDPMWTNLVGNYRGLRCGRMSWAPMSIDVLSSDVGDFVDSNLRGQMSWDLMWTISWDPMWAICVGQSLDAGLR